MAGAKEDRSYLFISNVDIRKPRGGWDGLGGKIFELLSEHFLNLRLLDKINPPVDFYSKAKSKFFRIVGWKADFPIFSKRRLNIIADELREKVHPDTQYLIFHGATPWINYKPTQQYCAILDCSFITYMQKF